MKTLPDIIVCKTNSISLVRWLQDSAIALETPGYHSCIEHSATFSDDPLNLYFNHSLCLCRGLYHFPLSNHPSLYRRDWRRHDEHLLLCLYLRVDSVVDPLQDL